MESPYASPFAGVRAVVVTEWKSVMGEAKNRAAAALRGEGGSSNPPAKGLLPPLPYWMFPMDDVNKSLVEAQFKLGPLQKVRLVDYGPVGRCYWNADRYVKEQGGTVVHGWLVMTWPNLFVEYLHHAIVRTEDGELIDVSAPPVRHNGYATFVVDESEVPPRDYPANVESRFMIIDKYSQAGMDVYHAHRAYISAERALMAELKRQGIPWVAGAPLPLKDSPRVRAILLDREAAKAQTTRAYRACKAASDKIQAQLRNT